MLKSIFQITKEKLPEEMSQFPPLLMEPWRVEELVEEESVIQRHRLFRAVAWLRIGLAAAALMIFTVLGEADKILITALICYIALLFLLVIRLQTKSYDIHNYSFFIGVFDIFVLAYLVVLSESNIEISFVFFSILLSAMLLPLLRLLTLTTLAAAVIVMGWTKSANAFLNDFFKTSEYWVNLPTQFNGLLSNQNSKEVVTMTIGLFVLAIITNRLANWSFKNEVKAQFRYKQMRQVLSFNRSVIEHLKTGVLVLTADAKVLSINQRAIELLNLNTDTAVNELYDLSVTLNQRYHRWLSSELDSNQPYRHNAGAEEVFVSFAGFGALQQKNIVMMTLESVNESFQQAQEAKLTSLGRLTAGIAHEIRNPLSSINSAAQLLSETTQSAQHQKLSGLILRNVKRTDQVISNVLGLFKDTKPKRQLLPVKQTLRQFCKDFSEANKGQAFKISLIAETDTPIFFLFDLGQFEQILWNLGQNSLKYAQTKELLIVIKYSLSPSRRNIYIDIMDNGVGIDEAQSTQIFEPFYTGGSSGSGLGLYLVRELCSANNANIVYMPFEKGSKEHGARFRLATQSYFTQNLKPKLR